MAAAIQMRRKNGGRALLLAGAALCAYQSAFPTQLAAVVAPDAKAPEEKSSFLADHSRLAATGVVILCLGLAKTENQKPPPSIGGAIEQRGDFNNVLVINTLLSLTSGMLNALAFLECSATIAHHSGNLTHWGRSWGTDSIRFACYLFAFLFGGVMIGFVKSDSEAIFVARYSPCLLAAVLATVGGTVIQLVAKDALATLVLWALAQGIQNALCRKFSSMPLCSTHFTGYLSDAGILSGAYVSAKLKGEKTAPMQKPLLFFSCMFAFAAGGYAAKLGLDSYGIVVALVPAVLMATVAFGLIPLTKPKKQGMF